jgi:DNA replicative helicase MCM subunit Mcm2 (Cdc46/Mcm family)
MLCDKVDRIDDERLAEFVVDSHMRSHPQAEPREKKAPEKSGEVIDQGKIISFYTELRKESASGGVAVAVRHI